ncbi:hypothetical protein F4861DRAFT_550730 [Xylaria intraflava]|nr:hypothetical protein F4861DRAFT_550730 [Xylaria intraflava]
MKPTDISNLSLADKQAVLDGPALPPPPGVTPNFDNPPNESNIGILTNVVCLVTTGIVFGLRAYAKIFCVKKVQIEDYLAAAALGPYISCIYCGIWVIRVSGLFVHQWNVRLKDLITSSYILHVGANLCAVTLMILKASIILEWIRIFVPPGTRNSFFWVAIVLLVIHTLFHVTWVVVENLSCTPYQKIWDVTISGGSCIVRKGLHIPAAAINLAADTIILILPQKTIWSLQMSKKNKIGLSLVFTIGFLAFVSAAFRLYKTIIFYESDDFLFAESGLYLWALAEMTCLWLVFCVPAIPGAFVGRGLKSKIKSLLSWSSKTSTDGSRLLLRSMSGNRPRSNQPYQPRRRSAGDGLMTPSAESIRGPVTEITADSHEGNSLRGVAGILCTTQFKAEVVTMDREDTRLDSVDGKGYERHQWSMMH